MIHVYQAQATPTDTTTGPEYNLFEIRTRAENLLLLRLLQQQLVSLRKTSSWKPGGRPAFPNCAQWNNNEKSIRYVVVGIGSE
jgi:hypothetical protein